MTQDLREGDCLEVLRTLPGESVDAVITDPPYGIDFVSGARTKDQKFNKIANDRHPFVWWIHDATRILKTGGCVLCFCRWDVEEAFRLALTWAGLDVRSQIIWDRGSPGMGDLAGSPGPQHDTVWFATKGDYKLPGGRPSSVYTVPKVRPADLVHPNQKPLELLKQMVIDYVLPGGVVLEPFAGSGTTGLACALTGRSSIMIEMDPSYCDLIEKRLGRVDAPPCSPKAQMTGVEKPPRMRPGMKRYGSG